MNYKSLNKLIILFISILFYSTVNASSKLIPNSVTTAAVQPRVALVLGGGGARGAAHLGVISVLQQAGVPIDLIVGTSIGSMVGAMYADDPDADAVSKILFTTRKNQLLNFHLFNIYHGPFSSDGIENYVSKEVHVKQFSDLKIKFVAVATDLNTGDTVPLYAGQINDAVAASMALPPFFPALNYDGKTLIDGGMADPVPVDIAKLYHPKIIIAVSIAENVPSLMSNLSAMDNYKRAQLIQRENFDKKSATGADVFIHPDVGQTGVFDDSHDYLLAQNGADATEQVLPQICALLKANHIPSHCDAMLKKIN